MKTAKIGNLIVVCASALVLIWIGILKFTPGEADAIKAYVENSFLLSWLYRVISVQQASDLIGIFEIMTGTFLIISFWNKAAGRIGGYMALVIFATTTSFLLTTPGIWKISQGVVVTDFFVLKDLAYLGIALQVIGKNTVSHISPNLS
ncbi:MAG: DUF417 family protein [Sphingobacteriales bacterium]